jgi:hypothetical protein
MLKDIKEFVTEQGPYIVPIALVITYCVYQLLVAVAETAPL